MSEGKKPRGGSSWDDEVPLKEIEAILRFFQKAINRVGVLLSDQKVNSSCSKCLKHHKDHIRRLRVDDESVDPLKIYAWFGYDVAENLTLEVKQLSHASKIAGSEAKRVQRHDVIKALVTSMNAVLIVEAPKGGLDPDTLNYLIRFLECELDEDSEHGIGQNGIFAAFHSALNMKRYLKSTMPPPRVDVTGG